MKMLLLILSLLMSASAFAWPPTYGAEFEFYHPMMKDAKENKGDDPVLGAAKVMYVENIKKLCEQKDCTVEKVQGKWSSMANRDQAADYKVTMSDGWWFKISHDPNCVEITTKPSDLEALRKHKDVMDEMIFDSGRTLGFRIRPMETAHFNIGINSAFEGDAKEFLRFFTDYHNHPELVQGVLGDDINNAPSLAILGQDQRDTLKKIVSDVNTHQKAYSLGGLAEEITRRVYTRSYKPEWGGAHHYQAVGLKYVTDYALNNGDRPMELRATWNQKNAEHFIKFAELIEARLNFLKHQNTKIIYSGTKKTEFNTVEMVTRYYFYVTEMGLSYARYKELLPHYLRDVPFDTFMNEKAPMAERLENIQLYQDMLAFSPGLQSYERELVRRAKQSHRPFDLSEVLDDLQRAKRVDPISCELVHAR